MTDEAPIPEPAAPASGGGFSWGLVVFFLFAAAFVVFVVQNPDSIEIRFLGWSGQFPLPLLLVVTALIAVLADEVIGVARRRRRRRRLQEKAELERYRRS
jgi:uncharacterized integral membrane protein